MKDFLLDNREYIQRLQTLAGYKVSSDQPQTTRCWPSFKDMAELFWRRITEQDYLKIHKFLHPRTPEINKPEIKKFCNEVLQIVLAKNAGKVDNVYTDLRDVFADRMMLDGCAEAIIFLKKFHYKKRLKLKTMQANQLQKGNFFKLPGKRKFHQVANVCPVPENSGPPEHKGKLIITTTECRQWILAPDREIILR